MVILNSLLLPKCWWSMVCKVCAEMHYCQSNNIRSPSPSFTPSKSKQQAVELPEMVSEWSRRVAVLTVHLAQCTLHSHTLSPSPSLSPARNGKRVVREERLPIDRDETVFSAPLSSQLSLASARCTVPSAAHLPQCTVHCAAHCCCSLW